MARLRDWLTMLPHSRAGMKLAVVGHMEWCLFLRVERVPGAGAIAHASEWWEEPAGGGGVAAVELVRLGGEADLYTSLGNDDLGRRSREQLEALGVRVHAAVRDEPTRQAVVFVHELADADAVYFVSGDGAALRAARRGGTLVATGRELATLRAAGVQLDALVASGEDEGERYRPGELDPPPGLVVTTSGALGGWAQPGGPYRATAPDGPFEDTYGCGDCFAAALAVALAEGLEGHDALEAAARSGAAALTRRGAHGR